MSNHPKTVLKEKQATLHKTVYIKKIKCLRLGDSQSCLAIFVAAESPGVCRAFEEKEK